MILFLSMSIITQYTKRGQIHYPAKKIMLGGGRRGTGVLSMFLFSNQIIKLHTHTTCPLHHTILILFKVEGGGVWEGGNLHSLYYINILKFFLVSAAMLTNLYLKRERYAKEVIVFRCCYCMYCYIVLVSPPPPRPTPS